MGYKKIVNLATLFALFAFLGCATTGAITNLEKKKTTKNEILSMFGEPLSKSKGSEGEVWEYFFIKEEKPLANNMWPTMNLIITFKDNVVKDYTVSVSKTVGRKRIWWKEQPPKHRLRRHQLPRR